MSDEMAAMLDEVRNRDIEPLTRSQYIRRAVRKQLQEDSLRLRMSRSEGEEVTRG